MCIGSQETENIYFFSDFFPYNTVQPLSHIKLLFVEGLEKETLLTSGNKKGNQENSKVSKIKVDWNARRRKGVPQARRREKKLLA